MTSPERLAVAEACEQLYTHAQKRITQMVEAHLFNELKRLHKEHFHRHTLHFMDAMGMTGVDLTGNKNRATARNGVRFMDTRAQNHPAIRELLELLEWYDVQSDDYGICARDLRLPAHTK